MNPSIWLAVSLWAVVVAGAALGMFLVWLYAGWAVHHGYRALSVLSAGEGEVSTPGWRKLWWWLLLSFAALVGGLVASNLIQHMI